MTETQATALDRASERWGYAAVYGTDDSQGDSTCGSECAEFGHSQVWHIRDRD